MTRSIATDRWFETSPRSPVSGAIANELLCQLDGYQVFRDPRTATDFVWPMPERKQLQALYDRAAWFDGGERGGYENYDQQTKPLLPLFIELLSKYEDCCPGRSLLDIGCGYGAHLAAAAERGWKSFGVEISAHAREIANRRHGDTLFITESVEKLLPHRFDVILLFDVLEHLTDPYELFYKLFSKGAIGPETRIAITTPNARSSQAIADPAGWLYRHPPSHLVYYSAESLRRLMSRLHFSTVNVEGIHPLENWTPLKYPDENFPSNDSLAGFGGLLCRAEGSNFAEFMHERYVPGTWSKLAEYEHLPRYVFASQFVSGGDVLDFGCGTGYGSALLAETAKSVRGIDIDEPALRWAREHHSAPNLIFERRADLGKNLRDAEFDVIVCFEVLEHLDEATQKELMSIFKRLLKSSGKLVISTPNPAVTANYGENPYHLRERTQAEFRELLCASFPHVKLLNQWIRPSVTIDEASVPASPPHFAEPTPTGEPQAAPAVAFLALCSQKAIGKVQGACYFDSLFDFAAQAVAQDQNFHEAQFQSYRNFEQVAGLRQTVAAQTGIIADRDTTIHDHNQSLAQREETISELNTQVSQLGAHIGELSAQITAKDGIIAAFQQAKVIRLRDTVKYEPFSLRKIAKVLYLLAAMATPQRLRVRMHPVTRRLKQLFAHTALPASADYSPSMGVPQQGREIHLRNQPPPAPVIEKISVVIPSKDAGPVFRDVLAGLAKQQFEGEVELIVIDSGSSDATADIAVEFGARVIHIAAEEFDHGLTRDLGVNVATGQIVVLMTQDAIPGNDNMLRNLAGAFRDPLVAGAYARQVPRADADVITQRNLHRWQTGRTTPDVAWIDTEANYRSKSPLEQYTLCTFDNVCSAVRKDVYQQQLPFLACEFGEDIEWGKRALEQGWKIAYQPEAYVIHSHPRSVAYEYRRNYACHRRLSGLFGLRTVPSMYAVASCTLRATLDDSRFVWRNEPRIGQKLSLLARTPFLTAAAVYAQYRGAKFPNSNRQAVPGS